jgi:hypothetical protein
MAGGVDEGLRRAACRLSNGDTYSFGFGRVEKLTLNESTRINELLELAYWSIQLIIFNDCVRSLRAVLSDCH